MFEATIEETFAAGHALRNYHGKCENPHGHNYRCELTVRGEQLDEAGLLADFVELKKTLHAVLDRLDHQWLNDLAPFDVLNPSAENMARHIYQEVRDRMMDKPRVRVASVRLWETDTASAIYFP
ncbi:MAG: 6-carboxytetrahydropterin synthase QueD [Bryobacteraceae bacterium]|jgi:6-pyruvoyltetrahydropterin/6-carboxytetrahydropterin synthase